LFADENCRKISVPSSESGDQFLAHRNTLMRKASRSPQGKFDSKCLPALFTAINIDEASQQYALATKLQYIATVFG
jgi:hypothetical protein